MGHSRVSSKEGLWTTCCLPCSVNILCFRGGNWYCAAGGFCLYCSSITLEPMKAPSAPIPMPMRPPRMAVPMPLLCYFFFDMFVYK
jgi:hypothetical protein